MKKKQDSVCIYDGLCAVMFLGLCLSTALLPEYIAPLIREALHLCGTTVIPSLFPFMVLSGIVTRSGIARHAGFCFAPLICPLFGIPKELCGAFLTGLIGGFPNGAEAVGILYENGYCSKSDAEKTIALCNNASPAFIFAVAGIYTLGSIKSGLLLFAAQFGTIFITAQILRFTGRRGAQEKQSSFPVSTNVQQLSPSAVFCRSVSGAAVSMLHVCAYIVIFYTAAKLLAALLPTAEVRTALFGLCEMSGAVAACRSLAFPRNIVFCAFALGFAGLSVLFQVTDVCERYKLSSGEFIFARLCGALLLPAVCIAFLFILPRRAISASAYLYPYPLPHLPVYSPVAAVRIILLYAGMFTAALLVLLLLSLFSWLIEKKQ